MSQNNTNTNYQNRNSNSNNNSNSRSNRNNNTNRNNNRNKHDGGKNTMVKNNKRNKSKNKRTQPYAFVMACNNATENECFDNQLLGGPSSTKRNEKGLGKTHERNKKITPLLFERCFL
jgi:hypothetical protein